MAESLFEESEANGVSIEFTDAHGPDVRSKVRNFASKLERGGGVVDNVSARVNEMRVWVHGSHGEFVAPDGYSIESVFIASNGGVCFRVARE